MTSVKQKKRLRYLLFWESESELTNNHRLKRWLLTKNTIITYSENRSEERRVGKECIYRGNTYEDNHKV